MKEKVISKKKISYEPIEYNTSTIEESIENTWLHSLYEKRKQQNRDLIIFVTDNSNDTGTGKTTLSILLGNKFDIHEFTEENTTMKVHELKEKFFELPNKSSLVFDELGSEADKFRQGSKKNRMLHHFMDLGRKYEKYIIINTPSKSYIGDDLLKRADVWISVTKLGKAVVHNLYWDPYSETLSENKKHDLYWDDITTKRLKKVYNHLDKRKDNIVKGKGSEQLIPIEEVEKRVEQEKQDASKKKRDNIIKNLYNNTELSQNQIAKVVDLTQGTVSEIINQ